MFLPISGVDVTKEVPDSNNAVKAVLFKINSPGIPGPLKTNC